MPATRVDVDAQPMPPIAIGMALSTFALFAVLDTVAKTLVLGGFAAIFVAWCRFAMQGVIVFFMSRAWRNRAIWQMNNIPLQILRGIALPLTTFLNFKALEYLQLAETVSIAHSSPMVVTALAGPLLGEWAGWRRWTSIGIGFLGVLLVVRPGTAMFSFEIFYSLAATLVYAIYAILTRKLAATETQESLVFYSCAFGIVLVAPFGFAEARMPSEWWETFLLCFVGVLGMAGHTLLVKTSRLTNASKVAPFVYTQLIWMVLLGLIVFGDVPDGWTMAGALVICGSGLYLMYRERVLRKERQKLEQLK